LKDINNVRFVLRTLRPPASEGSNLISAIKFGNSHPATISPWWSTAFVSVGKQTVMDRKRPSQTAATVMGGESGHFWVHRISAVKHLNVGAYLLV